MCVNVPVNVWSVCCILAKLLGRKCMCVCEHVCLVAEAFSRLIGSSFGLAINIYRRVLISPRYANYFDPLAVSGAIKKSKSQGPRETRIVIN